MTRRKIVVNKSPVKMASVRRACWELGRDAEIIGEDFKSGVPCEPMGEEIELGARNRAKAGLKLHPDAISIGIENGLFEQADGWVDKAVICIMMKGRRPICCESESVVVPKWCVTEVLRRGTDVCTWGDVLAEQTGCNPADPHAYVTEKSREEFLSDTLVLALGRIL